MGNCSSKSKSEEDWREETAMAVIQPSSPRKLHSPGQQNVHPAAASPIRDQVADFNDCRALVVQVRKERRKQPIYLPKSPRTHSTFQEEADPGANAAVNEDDETIIVEHEGQEVAVIPDLNTARSECNSVLSFDMPYLTAEIAGSDVRTPWGYLVRPTKHHVNDQTQLVPIECDLKDNDVVISDRRPLLRLPLPPSSPREHRHHDHDHYHKHHRRDDDFEEDEVVENGIWWFGGRSRVSDTQGNSRPHSHSHSRTESRSDHRFGGQGSHFRHNRKSWSSSSSSSSLSPATSSCSDFRPHRSRQRQSIEYQSQYANANADSDSDTDTDTDFDFDTDPISKNSENHSPLFNALYDEIEAAFMDIRSVVLETTDVNTRMMSNRNEDERGKDDDDDKDDAMPSPPLLISDSLRAVTYASVLGKVQMRLEAMRAICRVYGRGGGGVRNRLKQQLAVSEKADLLIDEARKRLDGMLRRFDEDQAGGE